MDNIVSHLISIGFCQPKFYKRTVWKYADRMMQEVCRQGLAKAHDFGKGKGKYTTNMPIATVKNKLQITDEIMQIMQGFIKYTNKQTI